MKEKVREIWTRYQIAMLLILIAMVGALLVELLFNIPVWKECKRSGVKEEMQLSELTVDGMILENDSLIVKEEPGEIHLYLEGKYVEKLGYSYQTNDIGRMMDVDIVVVSYDVYGNEQIETIKDQNPYVLNQSIVTIRDKVKEICITIPETAKGARISNIYVQNKPQLLGVRWLFFATLFTIILLLWKYRNEFAGKAERIFLLIGLSAGTLMVLAMPLNKVGLDEEMHFRTAYNIKLSKTVSSTSAIEELKAVTLANWPYNIVQSKEERVLMEEYYETAGDYTKNSDVAIKVPTEITMIGEYNYIFMALGIKLGKLLHLPFTTVYMLGRLFNLWMYVFLLYFAIKRLPIGKYIMAVLGLMPTPMFQASVYSYDPVVTGFMFLGLAYLIAELVEKDRKLTIKNGVIILGALGFGMIPKAVYVPMMALGFLIPSEKFENRKQKLIFRITNVVCILGLIATFAIPLLFSAGSMEDVRGGNVDAAGQLSLVLHHPISYVKVWLTNVGDTFWSYTFGEGALGTLGHLSVSTCIPLLGLLMLFVILTDNIDGNGLDLNVKQKIALAVASGISVGFIWGALYLSFNEVGNTFIGGVQGRYFIPLLFGFYMLLRRKQIKNDMNPIYYNYLVFGATLLVLYKTIYDCILYPHCF